MAKILASGKATATTTEQVIDTPEYTTQFSKISLDCSKCTGEVMFSIDKPFATAINVLYIAEGSIFEENLNGDKIYFKCASGTNTFNYVLL